MSETDWGAFQRWWIDTYCQDGAYRKMDDVAWAAWQAGASASSSPAPAAEPVPIDMLLYCPSCGKQHIDEPDHPYYVGKTTAEGFTPRWDNPPHRSHLCHGCGCIWRPADVPTNGVADIKTEGKADTWVGHAEEVSAQPAPTVPADRAGLVEECKLRVRAVRDESWHSAHGAQGVNVGQRLDEAFAAIDRLASSAAQVPEDARDAARYRWLRDKSATAAQSTPTVLARFPLCDEDHPMLGGLDLDEAIDLLLGFAAPAAGGEQS